MTNKKELDKVKSSKHEKYDKGRKNLPRLPSSRIKDAGKAETMEQLYLLSNAESKLDLIVDAAQFALKNEALFIAFRNKKNSI
jgi:hypothetical protein